VLPAEEPEDMLEHIHTQLDVYEDKLELVEFPEATRKHMADNIERYRHEMQKLDRELQRLQLYVALAGSNAFQGKARQQAVRQAGRKASAIRGKHVLLITAMVNSDRAWLKYRWAEMRGAETRWPHPANTELRHSLAWLRQYTTGYDWAYASLSCRIATVKIDYVLDHPEDTALLEKAAHHLKEAEAVDSSYALTYWLRFRLAKITDSPEKVEPAVKSFLQQSIDGTLDMSYFLYGKEIMLEETADLRAFAETRFPELLKKWNERWNP